MKYTLIICALLHSITLQSQCIYLAYDGLNYSSDLAMNGLAGGTGWQSPWSVQNGDSSVPGFNTSSNSLTYNDLQVIGNSVSGGNNYLGMGRRLNTAADGPFQDYVAANNEGIGSLTGDTLWTSFVLSKDQANDQSVFVSLHNEYIDWYHGGATQRIAAGYFGENSNISDTRYWTLLINSTYYISPVPVTISQNNLFVIRTIFSAGNTQVDFYINPETIGNSGIPLATISETSSTSNVIRSVAAQLGSSPGNASLDELRIGASYGCITPDSSIEINLPPTALISITPNSGMAPLAVSLDGSGSFDPENQPLSYLWDFGDGSHTSTAMNPPTHMYNVVGELTVSLTLTDNTGQEHTDYESLTILDSNGSFPCQTTVTCLQMASCNSNNGMLRVNAGNNDFSLRNSTNQVLGLSEPSEYHNLAAGNYTLLVNGSTSICKDSFNLNVRTDSTTCAGWAPSQCAMEIGTNLNGIADWSVERPFRNLMKNTRAGIITYSDDCGCWDGAVISEMELDSNGYALFLPQNTSIGSTKVRYVLSADSGNLKPDSVYVLQYDGIGIIDIIGVSSVTNTPNRLEFTAGSGNIVVYVEQSALGNHIRNFRLTRLIDEGIDLEAEPFYQGFLEKISPFSLLRFMDWSATNNSPVTSWAERSSDSYFTYGSDAGVPYEMIIRLANHSQKDIWLCVPHQAEDDYILQMATLFKDSLDENIVIYIEYSNELWNWIFDQAHYNNENRPSNLSYGRAMAVKAKNVFDIWHDVFNGQECRIKRVLGLQGGFNALNEEILSQLNTDDWDYGSPTHYFGLDHSENGNPVLGPTSTVQNIMDNAASHFAQFGEFIKQDYLNVQIYGKEVITYEGGQHFVGNVFGIPYEYQEAMWEAQNSQEMYNMYDAVLDSIRNWGCKLATNFTLSSVQESVYGSWGVLPDIDVQPPYSTTAKKYQALLDNMPNSDCRTQNSWTGKSSGNWSDPCNWDKNRIPTAQDQVLISANTLHQPVVNMNAKANTIKVAVGAVLNVLTGWRIDIH